MIESDRLLSATMRLLLLCAIFVGVAKADQLLYKMSQPSTEEFALCPDQNSKCLKESTCCQLTSGQWGCCPFAQASCCSDQVHCCPQGYSCNANRGQCVKAINNDTIPWAEKRPSPVGLGLGLSSSAAPGSGLTCADSSTCGNSASCCRTYTGTFRCCNYPNNVCCSDGFSCCPRCTVCDIVNRRCLQGFATEEWTAITESVPSIVVAVQGEEPAGEKTEALFVGVSLQQTSPGGAVDRQYCNTTHYCASYETCCLKPSGRWGCCPYAHATCCAGSIYCCPAGKRCSYPPGRCYG